MERVATSLIAGWNLDLPAAELGKAKWQLASCRTNAPRSSSNS